MNKFDMNLQYFAEGEPEKTAEPTVLEDAQGENNLEKAPGFSREQLAGIVSSQIDKFKKEQLPDLLQSKYEEGKKDAQLSAEELAQKQTDKLKEDLDRRERELNQREAMTATQTELTKQDLPVSFAKWLNADTEEKRTANINEFSKAFHDAVHQGVLTKTKGRSEPEGGNPGSSENDNAGAYGKRLAESLAEQSTSQTSQSFFN